MLYKRKKNKHDSIANRPYIGVIETTMMYKSSQDQKEYLISVFTLFVEEASRHLILIRFYEDFLEFDQRIKNHVKRFKTPLPKLLIDTDANDHGLKKKLFTHLVPKKTKYTASNSYNLEIYLRYCIDDEIVQSCSLFREFLQPQREEDNAIPKNMIQSIVNESIIMAQESPPQTLTLTTSYHSSSMKRPKLDPILTSTFESSTTNPSSISSSSERSVNIQDFQFIKVIGRGCMGKVLLVRHKKNNRLLALKAISKKTVIEQSQISHIKAEQQILADVSSIHHPFLIRLHYSFQDRNQLFLVLDYHVGGDLATQLRLQPTLPPERCRFYISEIILGIQELHRLGILYRDLKPENILLTADGHLVLTDFGLSKQFYDGLSVEDQRTNTFCGTAEYLAPEILNDQPYSYEVDYWSLGTVLYEMLLGITPFWAQDRDVMYERIRHDDLVFPADYLDENTMDFISQLLIRDPTQRLGSGVDGAIQVRSHPYFNEIEWHLIYTKKIIPPYIPTLHSETDLSFFESEFLSMTPRLSPVESEYRLSQSLEQAFEGYSYVNRDASSILNYNLPSSNVANANATRYFENEQVVSYDDYAESSSLQSTDDIRPMDLVREDSGLFTQDDYYPPRPARPVVPDMSLTYKDQFFNNRSSIHQ